MAQTPTPVGAMKPCVICKYPTEHEIRVTQGDGTAGSQPCCEECYYDLQEHTYEQSEHLRTNTKEA